MLKECEELAEVGIGSRMKLWDIFYSYVCVCVCYITRHVGGNCVRYGADQELGPNKRRAASEAAGLSVKWDRSIHRWNMEILTQKGTSCYLNLHNPLPQKIRRKLNFINRARIVGWCPGCWTKGAGGVQQGFISGARFELRADLGRSSPPAHNAQS